MIAKTGRGVRLFRPTSAVVHGKNRELSQRHALSIGTIPRALRPRLSYALSDKPKRPTPRLGGGSRGARLALQRRARLPDRFFRELPHDPVVGVVHRVGAVYQLDVGRGDRAVTRERLEVDHLAP